VSRIGIQHEDMRPAASEGSLATWMRMRLG
jgi:hypothetical protein